MFINASALVAILRREDDGVKLEQRIIASGGTLYVSPVMRYESTLSIARALSTLPELAHLDKAELVAEAKALVDDYLNEIGARDIEIDVAIGEAAIHAAMTFGKAVGHKATLNMGDCFSYACAKSMNVPLLYKGNDFAHTDLA